MLAASVSEALLISDRDLILSCDLGRWRPGDEAETLHATCK